MRSALRARLWGIIRPRTVSYTHLQDRFFCIYSVDNGITEIPDLQNIRYKPVPQFQWYYLDIELRDDSLIRQARYIQLLRVEARGHDYLTEVTGLSLVGTQ